MALNAGIFFIHRDNLYAPRCCTVNAMVSSDIRYRVMPEARNLLFGIIRIEPLFGRKGRNFGVPIVEACANTLANRSMKGCAMAALRMVLASPLPVYLDENNSALAPRPRSLEGKVVALLPNWRPGAENTLKALGTLIAERYRPKAVVMEQQVMNPRGLQKEREDPAQEKLDELARRVDVVITASGD